MVKRRHSIVYPDQLGKVTAYQVLVGGILEAEDHAPIKCRISCKWAVMDIGRLALVLILAPSAKYSEKRR